LGGGRVVEIDQRTTIHLPLQDGEVGADAIDVQRSGDPEHGQNHTKLVGISNALSPHRCDGVFSRWAAMSPRISGSKLERFFRAARLTQFARGGLRGSASSKTERILCPAGASVTRRGGAVSEARSCQRQKSLNARRGQRQRRFARGAETRM